MPVSALSLVGFLDEPNALGHLRNNRVSEPGDTDASLLALFKSAQASLGAAMPKAGTPEINPIPQSADAHIQALVASPWAMSILQLPHMSGYEFKLVEIDALLAFQLTVSNDRSDDHCSHLNNPTIDDLMPVCLPTSEPKGEFIQTPVVPGSQSVVIKTRNLNWRVHNAGIFNLNLGPSTTTNIAGLEFRLSSPFVYVGRYNGKCYLANGFHRAVGTRLAGATHVPCVFRELSDPSEIGIGTGGGTFSLDLLESSNPPTVGHFTQGRALPLNLRAVSRIIHVSWSDNVLPDE